MAKSDRLALSVHIEGRDDIPPFVADGPHGVIHFGTDLSFSCLPIDPRARSEGVRRRHCSLVYAGGSFRVDFDRGAGVFFLEDDRARQAVQLSNPFAGARSVRMRLGQPKGDPGSVNPVFVIERHDPDAISSNGRDLLKATRRRRKSDTIDRSEFTYASLWGIFPALAVIVAGILFLGAATASLSERTSLLMRRASFSAEVTKATASAVAALTVSTGEEESILGT